LSSATDKKKRTMNF